MRSHIYSYEKEIIIYQSSIVLIPLLVKLSPFKPSPSNILMNPRLAYAYCILLASKLTLEIMDMEMETGSHIYSYEKQEITYQICIVLIHF